MIRREQVTINGKAYVRTYSDTGMMIERDGVRMCEALDPAESGCVYFQTRIPIETKGGEKQ